MAARKSCTHMTWSEAKAKSGDYDLSKKKKKDVIQVSHGQALTAKIVRKNSAPSDFTKAELRRAKRQEEKALALAAKMAEEREAQRRERDGQTVCPYDIAKQQMALEAERRQQRGLSSAPALDNEDGCSLDAAQLAQCREMQLDEIAALEAIYADTDEFLLGVDADVDGLRAKIDEWQDKGGSCSDETVLPSIVHHPSLSFGLQLTVEDEISRLGGEGMDLVATLLLQIELPPSYPESSLPCMDVAYFAVTDRSAQMSKDKALESLVHLEEERLLQELKEQARQIVPLPCVYELAATWLTEHLFEYCTLRTHAQLSAG